MQAMTIQLPHELESYVRSQVKCGRFASEDEAIAEAVRRLRQAEQAPPAGTPPTEAEFKRQMLAAGLMTSLPTPADPATRPVLQSIALEGEPLSETIIRERR
jgi:putative addiction module CopG family antidote